MAKNRLTPPDQLVINFQPSPKQYELWKLLQPNYCPYCGGQIEQVVVGKDMAGNKQYKPQCNKCHTQDLPQIILGGGAAGGGKSFLGSVWIISSCIRFAGIRAVICRRTIKSLKESTFNTVRSVLKLWGLKEDIHFKINNLENTLTFWNDSVIILKELEDLPSDPNFERLGSSEFTIGFVDEVSEISEKAIETLFSRLRWMTHETFKIPRLLMTTNPCVNWVRSRFVQTDDGDSVKCKEGEAYVPFSVFDNPDVKFRQTYEAALNKITDRATRERLLYGNWDFVDSNDMAAYWNFNGEYHLVSNLKEKTYDSMKPIIVVVDFNVAPYMSALLCQVNYDAKEIFIQEEVLGLPEKKENNTPKLGKKIHNMLLERQHLGGVIVTGDPSGTARSTQTEDGVNNYTIIKEKLSSPILRTKIQLLSKQPPQAARLEFINQIFEGYDGWRILIDLRCRKLTEDLIYQQKNPDGTKVKAKATDPKTKQRYEKYGHMSDCLDYLVCLFAQKSWKQWNRHGSTLETTQSNIYKKFSY